MIIGKSQLGLDYFFKNKEISFATWKADWAYFQLKTGEELTLACQTEETLIWALEGRISDLRFHYEKIGGVLVGFGKYVIIECKQRMVLFDWDHLDRIKLRPRMLGREEELNSQQVEALISEIEKRRSKAGAA